MSFSVAWLSGFGSFAELLSLKKILFNQFVGSGAYTFTAAYWFIPCLFFVRVYFSVVHARVFLLLVKCSEKWSSFFPLFFLAVYFLLGVLAVVYSVFMYEAQAVSWDEIPILRFVFSLFFYYLGSIFQKYDLQRFLKHIVVLFALYVAQEQLWAMAGNLGFWMQASKYQNAFLPVVSSVFGTAFFYGISDIAAKNKSCSAVLGYIGKNYFPILLHHLFGFFIVNVVLCLIGVIGPSDVVGPYYQWNTVRTWPLYIFSGVLVSLAFDRYLVRPVSGFSKDFILSKRRS